MIAQERVQRLIDGIVARGNERALQVAAYWKGELVVDAWAGIADPATGRTADGNTLFPVFSTTKGIAATAVHILADRGILDYDTPIAKYWPEFGCKGKELITLRMALNHTAALPHMPDCKDPDELCDWDHMCRLVADLEPLWTPGTKTYYHAITYSWLIGEPARRADGRDFKKIIFDEVVKPLGLDGSLYVGLPEYEDARVAVLEGDPNPPKPVPSATPPPPDPVAGRSIPPLVCPLEKWMNMPAAWRGTIPASNGIMTAKAVAKHYASLIGMVDGVRLVSEDRLRKATAAAVTGDPEGTTRGLGYGLSGPPGDRWLAFGHGGAGGSIGSANVRDGLAIGFAKNRMGTSAGEAVSSGEQIVKEIRLALGIDDDVS